MPIVLEVRFQDFVAIVVLQETILLSITGDISKKQVGERITRSDVGVGRVKGEIARYRAGTELPSQFIFLTEGNIGSELQVMFPYDLGHVVAVCVSGVGIVNTVWNVSWVFAKSAAISVSSDQVNSGKRSIEAVLEDTTNRNIRSPFPISYVVQNDVVGGIAEYEFIEQGWV